MAQLLEIVATLLSLNLALSRAATTCNRRFYGESSFVCVCSESLGCNTIDPIQPQPNVTYQLYTSNQNSSRFALTTGNFTYFGPQIQELFSNATIKIQKFKQQHKIIGFGGAFTDSATMNIKSLPPVLGKTLLESYFGPQGIEYNFGRVPIGGTDFSTRPYSYDDTVEVDKDLKHFSLQPEDLEFKIPVIKQAMEMNPNLKLLASAWTAPKWMKTNGEYTGGAIKKDCYQTWANYHVRSVEEYDKLGISFWGLTTGNQPNWAFLNTTLSIVGWSPTEMQKWVGENLGPTMRNSSFQHLKILTLDDQRLFLPWWPAIIIKGNAEKYVDGIALHWYMDFIVPPVFIDLTHKLFPNRLLLVTESSRGNIPGEAGVLLGDWSRAEDYAHGILQNLNHYVSGWTDWNLALNLTGGPSYIGNQVDSPIIVNTAAKEFYKQPIYYAIGHFSKFIPRGSYKLQLEETTTTSQLETAAFQRPDNGIVVIMHNRKSTTQKVVISDPERGRVQLNLSPKSINSMVYW